MRRTSQRRSSQSSDANGGYTPSSSPGIHASQHFYSNAGAGTAAALQHQLLLQQQQQHQQEFGSTRRESLVKPTWQHITPGQIPTKTLEKINGILSDDSDEDDYPRRPSVVVHTHTNGSGFGLGCGVANCSSNNSSSSSGLYNNSGSGLGLGSDSGGQLRRKDSGSQKAPRPCGLIMHNDGPSTSSRAAAMAAAAAKGGANGGVSSVNGVDLCKNAGRALLRMVSSKRSSSAGDEERYDVLGKVIMLGDSGVGKTCLLIRFRDGKYSPNYYITTVGIDFRNKIVVVDGTRVKLQIWDTAGQERFRSVTHAYYRDAHALLLLYDVTNKTTYDNIRAWLGEIREYAQDDVVIVLIGNKADCSGSERQVKREDGERLANEHDVPFMETSAKTGLNVDLAFAAVARQLKSRGNENDDDAKFNVHDFVRDNTKARSICAQCKTM